MDEQSYACPLLRVNDRKSRHRRMKKLRRYERLAATSQLSLWLVWVHELPHGAHPAASRTRDPKGAIPCSRLIGSAVGDGSAACQRGIWCEISPPFYGQVTVTSLNWTNSSSFEYQVYPGFAYECLVQNDDLNHVLDRLGNRRPRRETPLSPEGKAICF